MKKLTAKEKQCDVIYMKYREKERGGAGVQSTICLSQKGAKRRGKNSRYGFFGGGKTNYISAKSN